MSRTIELDDDLAERLESHTREHESLPELIEELVRVYEADGAFLQEGYTE